MPTSIVEIEQYTPNPPIQVSTDSLLEVRGFYTHSFIGGDGVTPVAGNASQGEQGPYYSTTPTLDGSGNLVVPAHSVQVTTLSSPTGNYFEGLWVDGAFVQWLMPNNQVSSGWQIPALFGTPVAFDEIATSNAAKTLLNAPDQYATLAEVVQLIERLAGDFMYAAVGVNGISSASYAPALASLPIFVSDNDPRAVDASSYASLAAAVASIGSTPTRMIVSSAQAVTDDLTVPSTLKLLPVGAGTIAITTGKTLTYFGDCEGWPLRQVFLNATAGLGTVDMLAGIAKQSEIQWWGAVGDDSTVCNDAINAAIAAHKVCHVSRGTYNITGASGAAISMVEGHTLYGDGPASILHKSTAATLIQNENDTIIRDMTLRGRSSGTSFIAGEVAIQSNYLTISPPFTRPITESQWHGLRSKLLNLVVENWGSNGLQIVGSGTAAKGGSEVSGCTIRNIGQEGILCFGDGVDIHDNYISNTLGWGIDIQGSYTNVHNNTLVNVSDRVAFGSTDTGGIVLNCDVWSDGSYGNVISGNTLNGGTNCSIFLSSSLDYPAVNNIVCDNVVNNGLSNATGDLAAIQAVDNGTGINFRGTVIEGNTVYNSGLKGISTWATIGTKILGNTVDTTALTAIEVTVSGTSVAAQDADVSHNKVRKWASSSNALTLSGVQGLTAVGNNISDVAGVPSATYAGIAISGSTTNYIVASNVIDLETTHGNGVFITNSASHGMVKGNSIANCAVVLFYDSPSDYLTIEGNDLTNGNVAYFSIGGTHDNVFRKGNPGYNPVGSLAFAGGDPAVPATTVGYQNLFGYDCMVVVSGGTVTKIETGTASGYTDTLVTSGIFIISAGAFIKITYSMVPSWKWFGL